MNFQLTLTGSLLFRAQSPVLKTYTIEETFHSVKDADSTPAVEWMEILTLTTKKEIQIQTDKQINGDLFKMPLSPSLPRSSCRKTLARLTNLTTLENLISGRGIPPKAPPTVFGIYKRFFISRFRVDHFFGTFFNFYARLWLDYEIVENSTNYKQSILWVANISRNQLYIEHSIWLEIIPSYKRLMPNGTYQIETGFINNPLYSYILAGVLFERDSNATTKTVHVYPFPGSLNPHVFKVKMRNNGDWYNKIIHAINFPNGGYYDTPGRPGSKGFIRIHRWD